MNEIDLQFRRKVGQIFRAAQSVELFFIVGGQNSFRLADCFIDTTVALEKPADRRRAATMMRLALREGQDTTIMRCFAPHHAVRVAGGGQTLELLVCFQCASVRAHFVEEGKFFIAPISAAPLPFFNEFLPDYETRMKELDSSDE